MGIIASPECSMSLEMTLVKGRSFIAGQIRSVLWLSGYSHSLLTWWCGLESRSKHLQFSDASDWGCVATFGARWFQLNWSKNWLDKRINMREFVPIDLSRTKWTSLPGILWGMAVGSSNKERCRALPEIGQLSSAVRQTGDFLSHGQCGRTPCGDSPNYLARGRRPPCHRTPRPWWGRIHRGGVHLPRDTTCCHQIQTQVFSWRLPENLHLLSGLCPMLLYPLMTPLWLSFGLLITLTLVFHLCQDLQMFPIILLHLFLVLLLLPLNFLLPRGVFPLMMLDPPAFFLG